MNRPAFAEFQPALRDNVTGSTRWRISIMHRLPSQYSVTRFRLAAFLLLAKWVMFVVALAGLSLALACSNRTMTHFALVVLGLVLPVTIVQWLIAGHARCPLCIGHPLARKACVIHRDTRRLLGSYRLRVAMAVIFKGRFRCPYCGERTAVMVRQRRQG